MEEPFTLARSVVTGDPAALESLLIQRTGSRAAARWLMRRLDEVGSGPEIDHYVCTAAVDSVHGARLPPELWDVRPVRRTTLRAQPQDGPDKIHGDALLNP